jgi:hypothetical protein
MDDNTTALIIILSMFGATIVLPGLGWAGWYLIESFKQGRAAKREHELKVERLKLERAREERKATESVWSARERELGPGTGP